MLQSVIRHIRSNSKKFSVQTFYASLPNQYQFVQSEQWKHYNNVWNLFKANRENISLTLNRFHTLFWCFHCWLRKSKCRLGLQCLKNCYGSTIKVFIIYTVASQSVIKKYIQYHHQIWLRQYLQYAFIYFPAISVHLGSGVHINRKL